MEPQEEMIAVRFRMANKGINKGRIGYISQYDFDNYGVEPNIHHSHIVEFNFKKNGKHPRSVLNNYLELITER